MGKLVQPKVFILGYTALDIEGLSKYLDYTGNGDFALSLNEARKQGVSAGEILCSFYAKLCYASLTLGKNDNITRIRDIPSNLQAAFHSGHGSVFEHASINFVATNVSRVFTHELVRHRIGTAFSQTSGRYVRGDKLDLVLDPILDPVKESIEEIQRYLEESYNRLVQRMKLDEMTDFSKKKKATSALRRILPNGQANEIGFTLNIRSLRHIVQVRTSRHAEWEIREVFSQVYRLVKAKFPLVFYGAKEEIVEGLVEVSGMTMQPYDKQE